MIKLISIFKRHLPLVVALGLITPWAIAPTINAQSKAGKPTKKVCPLSETYGMTASKKSPVAPEPYRAVLHNGFLLCVPESAWEAHIQHGDIDKGPCTKPGRQ